MLVGLIPAHTANVIASGIVPMLKFFVAGACSTHASCFLFVFRGVDNSVRLPLDGMNDDPVVRDGLLLVGRTFITEFGKGRHNIGNRFMKHNSIVRGTQFNSGYKAWLWDMPRGALSVCISH